MRNSVRKPLGRLVSFRLPQCVGPRERIAWPLTNRFAVCSATPTGVGEAARLPYLPARFLVERALFEPDLGRRRILLVPPARNSRQAAEPQRLVLDALRPGERLFDFGSIRERERIAVDGWIVERSQICAAEPSLGGAAIEPNPPRECRADRLSALRIHSGRAHPVQGGVGIEGH